MKTLKSALAGIALLFICVAANATVKPIADKQTKDDVLNIYIDAITHGKTTNLESVLSIDLKFNMQRGENVNTLDKGQMLDYLKSAGTSASAVTTTTSIIESYDDSYIVKVQFKYDDVVRTDEVTMANYDGWVITNVNSSFK